MKMLHESNVVQRVYVNQAVLRCLCPTSAQRHRADAATSARNTQSHIHLLYIQLYSPNIMVAHK